MRDNKRTLLQRLLHIQPGNPNVVSLLAHIVESAFSGGIFLILLFGSAFIAFLHYNDFSTKNLLALLLGVIIVMSFYRGCVAWQQDLDEHRRRKSGMRHRYHGRT